MPISGTGMMMTLMDIDAEDEADFNRWYDKEHLTERVGIDGFLEARRYVAVDARPKYLNLYTTRHLGVLHSDSYREILRNQTEWSLRVIAKFRNRLRATANVTTSIGQGRGGTLLFVRVRPGPEAHAELRASLRTGFDALVELGGIISAHLLEGDPGPGRSQGTNLDAMETDWYLLIEGTNAEDILAQASGLIDGRNVLRLAEVISKGTYRLLWDLARHDLYRRPAPTGE